MKLLQDLWQRPLSLPGHPFSSQFSLIVKRILQRIEPLETIVPSIACNAAESWRHWQDPPFLIIYRRTQNSTATTTIQKVRETTTTDLACARPAAMLEVREAKKWVKRAGAALVCNESHNMTAGACSPTTTPSLSNLATASAMIAPEPPNNAHTPREPEHTNNQQEQESWTLNPKPLRNCWISQAVMRPWSLIGVDGILPKWITKKMMMRACYTM